MTMSELYEYYVYRVNAAMEADREDVVRELNDEYVEEALRLILATA